MTSDSATGRCDGGGPRNWGSPLRVGGAVDEPRRGESPNLRVVAHHPDRYPASERPVSAPPTSSTTATARRCKWHGDLTWGRVAARHINYFTKLLDNAVSLSKFKLGTVNARVNSIYETREADDSLGPRLLGKIPRAPGPRRPSSNPLRGSVGMLGAHNVARGLLVETCRYTGADVPQPHHQDQSRDHRDHHVAGCDEPTPGLND